MNIRDNRYFKSPPRMQYTRILKYNESGYYVDSDPFAVCKNPISEVKSGNEYMFTGRTKEPVWLSTQNGKKRLKILSDEILLWKYMSGFEIKRISQKELNSLELY